MTKNFENLGISQGLEQLLKKNSITEPTHIQEQVIPILMEGKDVIAQAQTGTGKTLAFLLPIMERIQPSLHHVQALIITPTRELALQITAEAKKLAPEKGIQLLAAYGGQDVEQQIKKLKGAVHLVIGTPGRLLDHIGRKTVHFGHTSMLVLDEADLMLDMGFLTDVEQIIRTTSDKRQTMLFSATLHKGIHHLISKYMRNPQQVRIQNNNVTLDEIRQLVVETTDRRKQDALCAMISETNPFMAMIFCRTKRRVTALNEDLQGRGFKSDELHGDLTQGKREKVMKAFRKAELQLLVATDVAARGLDIEGVTHVFNYDMPHDTESYIHRIGRTGRAGQKGMAVTFATHRDREDLHMIEKGIKATIEKRKMSIPDEVEEMHEMSKSKGESKNSFGTKGPRRHTDRKPYDSKKPGFRHSGPASDRREKRGPGGKPKGPGKARGEYRARPSK